MKAKKKPAYTLHKATGQARVRLNGKEHYLGPYFSSESRQRYDELIVEWLRQGDVDKYRMTIDDLCLLYLQHARGYYRKNGRETSEVSCVRVALRPLVALHGQTRLCDFSPLKLKAVREAMIKAGWVRTSINRQIGRIRTMFRWAVENEHCPVSVLQALGAVRGLKKGRTAAAESEPVEPVGEGTVDNTLPYLPRVVADMVRLQLLTGARPSEVCVMRPSDITFLANGTWCFRPEGHKTEHHNKERRIYIGPRGQEIVRPYLDRASNAYCFSPAESEASRNAERKANRRSPLTPSQRSRRPNLARKRPPTKRYSKNSYRRVIERACIRAGIEAWAPNQLRHSRATLLRERYGIEAAQLVLGHSDPRVTEIYAERDFATAARIMGEIG